MKKKFGTVFFSGRKNCTYSKKIKIFLKKRCSKLYYLDSNKIGEKLPKNITKRKFDYLFLFRSYFIIEKKFLKKIKNAAINFHPSPPKYRGAGGVNYAIYNQDNFFGSTAHLIDEKIDNGKIINFAKFKISKNITIKEILDKTYKISVKQAFLIISQILKNHYNLEIMIKKNKNNKWSKKFYSIKKLDKFYQIDTNIKKKDLLRKIKSTRISKFKPYILLHGKKFILE